MLVRSKFTFKRKTGKGTARKRLLDDDSDDWKEHISPNANAQIPSTINSVQNPTPFAPANSRYGSNFLILATVFASND